MHLALFGAVLVLAATCGCGSAPAASSPAVASPAVAPPKPTGTGAAAATDADGEDDDNDDDDTEVQAKGPFPQSTDPALRDPSRANQTAPATFSVRFVTTVGDFQVDCTRDWAPHGVDRFYNLVRISFFDDVAFFRVVKQPVPFIVQFGIHGNPQVSKVWFNARIPPDEPKQPNARGMLTFAMAGARDTRTTQLFISFSANPMLDKMGFAPICKVAGAGMDVVDRIEGAYGEDLTNEQEAIQALGNTMLRARYPFLDYIQTARLIEPAESGK